MLTPFLEPSTGWLSVMAYVVGIAAFIVGLAALAIASSRGRRRGVVSASAVLVTGASTGIGRATALALDARGITVFAGVRKPADGDALVAAGQHIVPLILDVTIAQGDRGRSADDSRVGHPAGGARQQRRHCRGGTARVHRRRRLPPPAEVNVVGQLAVTQSVLPLLRASKGRMVNITSIGGLISGPMLGPYHASKFALEAMTDTLRMEPHPGASG